MQIISNENFADIVAGNVDPVGPFTGSISANEQLVLDHIMNEWRSYQKYPALSASWAETYLETYLLYKST